MNIGTLRKQLIRPLIGMPGWHTDSKIVVIESDDWGSIRMPSKKVFDSLIEKGLAVDRCPYCRNDSLATEEDLTRLFETLHAHRDVHGAHPVMTANCVMTNPDFDRIRKDDFQSYHDEPFTETLGRYRGCGGSFALWQEGRQANLFYPQYHGREHLHVNRWMNVLRSNLPETRLAFDHGMFGVSTTITSEKRPSYLAPLEIDTPADETAALESLVDGVARFVALFGYPPLSFIAPNYIWFDKAEYALAARGVRFFQGVWLQHRSMPDGKRKKKLRYTGKRNAHGQVHLVRNVYFEPSLNPGADWVGSALKEIETAFRWKKPAVICSHRVNYIGAIDPANRDRSLAMLNELFKQMLERWPDVAFMTSDRLGRLIEGKC
jgi:hypothetical protein